MYLLLIYLAKYTLANVTQFLILHMVPLNTRLNTRQYGSVKENCRLGRAIAKPNKVLAMLGFVPQPNLRYFWFSGLTERYWILLRL